MPVQRRRGHLAGPTKAPHTVLVCAPKHSLIDVAQGASSGARPTSHAKPWATHKMEYVLSTMLRPEWRWLVCNRLVSSVTGVAMVVVRLVSACGQAQTAYSESRTPDY